MFTMWHSRSKSISQSRSQNKDRSQNLSTGNSNSLGFGPTHDPLPNVVEQEGFAGFTGIPCHFGSGEAMPKVLSEDFQLAQGGPCRGVSQRVQIPS